VIFKISDARHKRRQAAQIIGKVNEGRRADENKYKHYPTSRLTARRLATAYGICLRNYQSSISKMPDPLWNFNLIISNSSDQTSQREQYHQTTQTEETVWTS
jgi:hypothetical protein